MTLDQALSRLLAEAPCTARIVAPGAVEVTAIRRAEPAPALQSAPPTTVETLLVTATKRVRSPRELAVAVTAIPRRQLNATGAADADEAAGQLAGVLATNLGPGRNKLLLRGLSDGAYTGRARSIVATYLDDIPINYNAPDPDLRLVDVDRVEVARGPQGALYGAGSLSGVYRIVTRKPDLRDWSAEARGSGALTKGGAESYAGEAYVNLPIWRDVAALRVAGYHETQGGYLDDVLQARSNVDETLRQGARVSLLVSPSDNWSVTLTGVGQHLRSEDTHYTSPGLGLKRAVRIPEPHVNDIELATATVRYSWGWAELTSASGYVRHRYGSLFDATATQELYTAFARTSAYSERTRTEMLVQDLVLTSRGAGDIEWLVGFYGSDTKVASPTEFLAQVPRAPNILVYGDDRRDDIRELAAYGEAAWRFGDGWILAVGGRLFDNRTDTRSDVVSERFAPRTLERRTRFRGFSPKLSLQKSFASGDFVYAVASEGHRSGGINSGGALPLTPAREVFAPDRLLNLELGLKTALFNDQLTVNSAVFYSAWTNIQTDQFRPSGIPYTTNAGDARTLGLETEIGWRGPGGLTAQINGRLSRTRTLNVNPEFTNRLVNGLPGAPSISGGAVISWERELGSDWMVRLVGQATYVGPTRLTFDASLPRTGGYARTKLSAELSRGDLGVQIYAINPLDSVGDTFAFGNPFNPEGVRQITPKRPVTIGVTLSAAL
jgi:outer membrane receptor protein involved in Fe transport